MCKPFLFVVCTLNMSHKRGRKAGRRRGSRIALPFFPYPPTLSKTLVWSDFGLGNTCMGVSYIYIYIYIF